MDSGLEKLRSIKSFPSLLKYLRDELEWPIESDDVEDLTFEYEPDELGIDPKTAIKIKEIKQLRPLATNQPWGIFYLGFEPKQLPIVALRRILRALVIKKRASDNQSQMATWQLNDLLFISAYGESEQRQITFAHFSENSGLSDLPTLKVLGWNNDNTVLRLDDTHRTLKEKLHWPEDEANADEWRERWSAAFKLQYRETVRTSKELSIRLAELAIVIRKRANHVLAIESNKGELRKLYNAFQEALIHDLTEDDFADMYAQTIAYGLLSARISRPAELIADNLADMVPVTNPFLKELLQTFLTVGGRKSKIDFDELGINEIVELLRAANMEEVLKDFGARNPNEDPVIHFYELFLKEYDPEKRMKRGVFYTPKPVVSFIVRSVHEILQKEFGLADGLADTTTWQEFIEQNKLRNPHSEIRIPEGVSPDAPFVQILDPATGTGTFLVEVINVIHDTLEQKWQQAGKSKREQIEAWNEYVPKNLLPRLYGFELMMAPYSIAHMKIGLKLSETGYGFSSNERAQIYLTNTLEEPKDFSDYFVTMSPALAHEAEAANRIKQNTPITVVVGNPPYSNYGMLNKYAWILALLEDYKKDLNEKKLNLDDDFIKFLRFGQWRIDMSGIGVMCYISNNIYIDGITHRQMRHSLMSTFDNIFINDLHGGSKRKERNPDGSKDENVFDIQQGVSIGLFSKSLKAKSNYVGHTELWGSRSSKYATLLQSKLSTTIFTTIDGINHKSCLGKFYFFEPRAFDNIDEYCAGQSIKEVFTVSGQGIKTERDHVSIHWTKSEVENVVADFDVLTEEQLRRKYSLEKDSRDWKVTNAKLDVKANKSRQLYQSILYRPFDTRHTWYSGQTRGFIGTPGRQTMQHMLLGQNIGLIATRQTTGDDFGHVLCANKLTEIKLCSHDRASGIFPLYVYAVNSESIFTNDNNNRRANLAPQFIAEVAARLNLRFLPNGCGDLHETFAPEDVFHYAYAVFHSPTYRTRYAEFLKIDFPRVPLTTDTELFRKLCAFGKQLVTYHLLEGVDAPSDWKLLTGASQLQNVEVGAGFPKYEDGKVSINKTAWFEGVPAEVWNFHIGGYQVCHKWLKDRKGRTLSAEDITHYGKIVVALGATIRLMTEIDEVIEEYGGFPLVGSQTRATPAATDGRLSLPFA